MRLSLCLIGLLTSQVLFAQLFTEVPPPSDFEGVNLGAIAFADVDGDEDTDVLITGLDNSADPITNLYRNDGSGNYTPVLNTPFENVFFSALAFSDVDGDGDSDVLLTGDNTDDRIAKLYLNDGIGNFTEVMGTPFAGVSEGSVAFADIDGDADDDVLITGFSSSGRSTKLFTNDGLGNFTEVMGTPFDAVSRSAVAFSDVDGDGDNDVLITGNISGLQGMAKLYTNDGAGNFTEVMNTPFEGVFESSIAFSDVDGDEDNDVLITGENDFGVFGILYANDGTGNFSEVVGSPFASVFNGAVAFSDIDNDGDSDVIITGENDAEKVVELYTNDGAGNFTEVANTNFERVAFGTSAAFFDADGDGYDDLLITGRNDSFDRTAKLYLNDGTGGYPVILPPPFPGVSGSSIEFSDVDGDGDNDLLLTGFNDGGNRVAKLYSNDGSGIFSEVLGTPFEGINSGGIAFSDVDGDGDNDVLFTGESDAGRITKLYANDGSGSFSEVLGTPFTAVRASRVGFTDVDGDGDSDVFLMGAPNPGPEIIELYINDGMGNFSEATDTPFDNIQGKSFAFADVDGDQDNDLLLIGRDNTGPPFTLFAKLYANDGAGNFTEVTGTPFVGAESSAIVFSDVDGDGDNDVLITGAASPGDNIAKLYRNDGAGNFSEVLDTPFEGVHYSSMVFSDVEGDGDNDVLIVGSNTLNERIAKLYLNDGDGGYTEEMDTPFTGVAGSSTAIAFADIDGDGDHDVLITGQDSELDPITKLYVNNGDGVINSVAENPTTLGFEFAVYPNPAYEVVHIKVGAPSETFRVTLTGLEGEVVFEGVGSSLTSINTTNYPPGYYVLTVNYQGQVASKPVILH
jgi:hypothetical protein